MKLRANQTAEQVITIDGLSATGKTTLCMALAKRLGWSFLLSGMLYRFIAHRTLLGDSLIHAIELTPGLSFHEGDESGPAVQFMGQSIRPELATEAVAVEAAFIAKQPSVREEVNKACRVYAQSGPLIAEGRDMGSVVFPSAVFKVFLQADGRIRHERRQKQLQKSGKCAKFEISRAMIRRDGMDSARTQMLAESPDVLVVNTDGLSADQVCETVCQAMREHLNDYQSTKAMRKTNEST